MIIKRNEYYQEALKTYPYLVTSMAEILAIDELTKCFAYRWSKDFLNRKWNQLKQTKRPLSLMMIDIDYFKSYNDFYTSTVGDVVFRLIGKVLLTTIQNSSNLIVRYGKKGKDFAIILPNINREEAKKIANNIVKDISKLEIPHKYSKISEYLTVSIGVSSIIPNRNQSSDILVEEAEKAVENAKNQGRNRIIIQ